MEVSNSSSNRSPLDQNDRKRVVDSSIFRSRFEVRCASLEYAVNVMNPDPNGYPNFMINGGSHLRRLSRNDFRGLTGPGYRMKVAKHAARRWIHGCLDCECDQETAEIIANPRDLGTMVDGRSRNRCKPEPGSQKPQACRSWWNCFCQAKALQPDIVEGEDFADHFDALNRLPQAFRDQHPDYEWVPPNSIFLGVPTPIVPSWRVPVGASPVPRVQLQPPAPPVGIDAELLRVAEQELNELEQYGMGEIDPELLRVVQQELDLQNQEPAAGPSGTNRLYGAEDFRGWDKDPYAGSGSGFGFGGGGAGAGAVKKREISTLDEAPNPNPGQELKAKN
ncbi:hypothetical protein TWF506_005274 [Arthrobotrys conoides]|uniref:Uncharacterized protein n=1 Tax=Arthrobotrys conoides TaxID=74498 RepID=A0AAN8RPT6_9PEZI